MRLNNKDGNIKKQIKSVDCCGDRMEDFDRLEKKIKEADKEVNNRLSKEDKARYNNKKNLEESLFPLVESRKALNEEFELSNSEYKDIIGKYFDYSFNFDFLDVVASVIDRIDFKEGDLDSEIYSAVDNGLIYGDDQWTVYKYYVSSPGEENWEYAQEAFTNDIFSLANEIKSGMPEEDEEDEEEDEEDEFDEVPEETSDSEVDTNQKKVESLTEAGRKSWTPDEEETFWELAQKKLTPEELASLCKTLGKDCPSSIKDCSLGQCN